MNHQLLCQLAVAWLRRPESKKGPGCQVAISEPRCGWLDGEIPDAIGFRSGVWGECSVVVEAKTSRNDFLADINKPHRQVPDEGVGTYRYYIAPAGLIKVAELPPKWGLIEVAARGALKLRAGHVVKVAGPQGYLVSDAERYRHDRNIQREWSMLARLVMKFDDPEKAQLRVRDAERARARLVRENAQYRAELDKLRHEHFTNSYLLSIPEVRKAADEAQARINKETELRIAQRRTEREVRRVRDTGAEHSANEVEVL